MKISLSRALKAGLAMAAAVMALAGCATTGDGAAQMSAQWTGKDAAAVQAAWGHADEKTSLADGSEVWVYHRTKPGTVGDQAVTVRRDNTEYDQQGGTNLSRQVPYNAPQYDPNLAVAAKCDASFTLKAGVVASAVFKGSGCS